MKYSINFTKLKVYKFTMVHYKMLAVTKNWILRKLQLDIDFKTLFEINSKHLGILGKYNVDHW